MEEYIPVTRASEIILSSVRVMGAQKVDILSALGRVIAEDVFARRDHPPWDCSAMDGFAVRSRDVAGASRERPGRLRVIANLPAGEEPTREVGTGEAIRIMTGAPMPAAADTVVRLEDTRPEGPVGIEVLVPGEKGANVRHRGEDLEQGERIIEKGMVIRPAEVGLLAATGRSFVPVHQRPRVAILSTGDELVEVDGEVGGARIINSNSFTLAAAVIEAGGLPVELGIARDEEAEVRRKIEWALPCDVILTSAGVSVGDRDCVRAAIQEAGARMRFWRVAIAPGKPLAYGTLGERLVFGLPGNPVSALVSFELFVRPALLKMAGHRAVFRRLFRAVLAEDACGAPGRRTFLRAQVVEKDGRYWASTSVAQGSGVLRSMSYANALAVVPEDRQRLRAGEEVDILFLDHTPLASLSHGFLDPVAAARPGGPAATTAGIAAGQRGEG